MAELARLVGQDDPYRSVFRPAPVGGAAAQGAPQHAYAEEPHHGEAHYGFDPDDYHGHLDGHGHDQEGASQAYDDPRHPDSFGTDDERYYAADQEAHRDDAGFADERFATEAAAAATLPDMWAHGGVAPDGGAPAVDHGPFPSGVAPRSSARRPLAVLAAVLVLTGGGLAASFLAKGPSTVGGASVAGGRGAPTILAASGPTKVKVEDPAATAPEDKDAALLNRNAAPSSGPVKITSSQEQPVDLGQLPKASDLAEGARPLPPPSPSPFPEPRKVRTFVVHPDGTMLSADGAPTAPDGSASAGPASPDALGAAVPATPKTASRGATTPKSAPPTDVVAALSAPSADAAPAKPPHQPAAPGVRAASTKPNDVADAPAKSFGVQLASSPVEADANAAFAKLKKKYPAQLGSLTASVHKAETGDKPVYRVRVGSMSQDEAKALCAQLTGAGGSCFVVHN